jgi:hypothetical protein
MGNHKEMGKKLGKECLKLPKSQQKSSGGHLALSSAISKGFKELPNEQEGWRTALKSLGPQGLCGFDSRPPHQS